MSVRQQSGVCPYNIHLYDRFLRNCTAGLCENVINSNLQSFHDTNKQSSGQRTFRNWTKNKGRYLGFQ